MNQDLGGSGVVGLRRLKFRISGFRRFGVLGFESFGVLGFMSFKVLKKDSGG